MKNCHTCGAPIPDDQGSDICSMCAGDIDHGKDGLARQEWEHQDRLEHEKAMEAEREEEERANDG